jgi:hypothetical protein
MRKETTHGTIFTLLLELDQLYHSDDLSQYEQKWQSLAQQAFPGLTIAYAELYNSGVSRLSDAAIRHMLVPQPQMSY